MPLALTLPPLDPRPANPPETRPAKVFAWLDEPLTARPGRSSKRHRRLARGDQPRHDERVAPVRARRALLGDGGDALAAAGKGVRARHRIRCRAQVSTRPRRRWASRTSCRSRTSICSRTRPTSGSCCRAIACSPRSSSAACSAPRASSSTATCRTRPCRRRPGRTGTRSTRSRASAPQSQRDRERGAGDDARSAPIFSRCCWRSPIRTDSSRASSRRCCAICRSYSHWAKLTDVAPVHRMAKAVAIIPVGHDFPPFSANKGGSIDGSKIFLLTFDLAFQIQEAAARARSRRRRSGWASRPARCRGSSTSRCCAGCCGNGRFRRRVNSTGCRRAPAS